MALLVDATTAEHARGIRTVILGVLDALPGIAPGNEIVAAGPSLAPELDPALSIRRVPLARSRPGRLLYQRLLLPFDASRLAAGDVKVDRVLLLDSYVPLLRPQRDVRYGVLVHDLLPLTHPEYWPTSKRLVKRTALRSLRRAPVTLFTSTEHNAREIHERLGMKARVVHFGCGQLTDQDADEAAAAPLPTRQPYLLYVGALEPRKNVMSMLEVFEHLRSARDADLQLILAGDGHKAYVTELEARISRSPEHERVRIVRRTDRARILDLVAHASALVLPTAAEGFGLPVLEALALGTSVVVSDIPAIRSWAEDAVAYAPPDRPAAWIEPIESALSSDEARRRSGQAFARGYRWQKCASDLISF